MRKIIVKCKLSGRDKFENKLSEIDMDFSPVYWQHDRVYVPRSYKWGVNLPRLVMRTEMKAVDRPAKYTLILKRHIEDSGVDVEEKTVVKNYEEMVNIILQLGFRQTAEVSRRRQELKVGEGTYLYLDKVDNLNGFYAKMETELLEKDSVIAVKEDLIKTLEVLGEKNLIEKAYFEMN